MSKVAQQPLVEFGTHLAMRPQGRKVQEALDAQLRKLAPGSVLVVERLRRRRQCSAEVGERQVERPPIERTRRGERVFLLTFVAVARFSFAPANYSSDSSSAALPPKEPPPRNKRRTTAFNSRKSE